MKLLTNVVALVDPADELDALTRLTCTKEQEERILERRREHRREKRLNMAVNVAFVAVLCICSFVIGYCCGGW